MYKEDDDNESLPVARRCSLVNRTVNHFGSDDESSPFEQRQSRILLNNSRHSENGLDENIPTPIQLITLYEKTIELASKNRINAQNAFHFSIVDRLPEIIDIIAFDNKIDFSNDHHEPNFAKAGSIIDTSAKIYGYRVDALHTETQKLNGTIQQNDNEELNITTSNSIEPKKKSTFHRRSHTSSYIATDLSTISLSDTFEFHPLQPPNICRWLGGVGIDSLYADMISYTMYSSSDFPLTNGFINLNKQINNEYHDNEQLLDIASEMMYDLNSLRELIKEHDGQDHILGCQELREFSFNENPTESYIESIDECSIMNYSLMSELDNQEPLNDEYICIDELSEPRDGLSTSYFQELKSVHTFPTTMVSMDMALLHSKMSFADQIPQLIRDKNDPSEYNLFDSSKLKLFTGPYLWKYTNLLSTSNKSIPITQQQTSQNTSLLSLKRHFKFNLLNEQENQTLDELMNNNSWTRKSLKNRKRKILSTILHRNSKYRLHEKNHYQLKISRKLRSLSDLSCLHYYPDYNLDVLLNNNENDFQLENFDSMDYDNPLPEQDDYDFSRPIQYDKIECDENFSKIDAKKLQTELYHEYNRQSILTTNPISLSTLCVKLIDQGMISVKKNQLISAFYCMLNTCNKNQLYMKPNSLNDDLIIQQQPFIISSQLIYSQSIV